MIKVRDNYMKGGKVDTCAALTELIAEGRREGEAQGRAEGKVEAILDLLQDIGGVSPLLASRIMGETNDLTLRRWLRLAARAGSVGEFKEKM